MSISGADLKTTYKLAQIHFHWGENNYQGSEHLLDDEKFPLEVCLFIL